MLLQSTWYLDLRSCSVTLTIISKQEKKRVKKNASFFMLSLQGDQWFLLIVWSYSLCIYFLDCTGITLGYIGQQRTWKTVWEPTHPWVWNFEPHILSINDILNRIENIRCLQCVLYDKYYLRKLKCLNFSI